MKNFCNLKRNVQLGERFLTQSMKPFHHTFVNSSLTSSLVSDAVALTSLSDGLMDLKGVRPPVISVKTAPFPKTSEATIDEQDDYQKNTDEQAVLVDTVLPSQSKNSWQNQLLSIFAWSQYYLK